MGSMGDYWRGLKEDKEYAKNKSMYDKIDLFYRAEAALDEAGFSTSWSRKSKRIELHYKGEDFVFYPASTLWWSKSIRTDHEYELGSNTLFYGIAALLYYVDANNGQGRRIPFIDRLKNLLKPYVRYPAP